MLGASFQINTEIKGNKKFAFKGKACTQYKITLLLILRLDA